MTTISLLVLPLTRCDAEHVTLSNLKFTIFICLVGEQIRETSDRGLGGGGGVGVGEEGRWITLLIDSGMGDFITFIQPRQDDIQLGLRPRRISLVSSE